MEHLTTLLWEGCSSVLQGDLLYSCCQWTGRLFAHLGSSSFICATLQCVSSELICWGGRVFCDSGVTLTVHPPLWIWSPWFQGVASPLWLPCSLLLRGYTRKAETFLPEAGEQIQSLADLEQWTAWRRCASRTHASTEPAPVAGLQKCHRQNESSGNSQAPQVWQATIQPHLLCKTGPFISSSYLCPTPNNMGLPAVLLGG